jgi:regulator of replication initiation timing
MPYEKRKKDGKVCVYKEGDDKPVGCHATDAEADAQIAALHANEKNMSTLDAEIFAIGKWNGMAFSADDLEGIVGAFESLGDKLRVPLKFGHNDEQHMTDGKPALGWVEKVWVAGEKLMARFTDVPDIVMACIKKKKYKNVSIELDMDVKHMGKDYANVLTGVALLGADIPAVNTLKDLTHYLSRGAAFSVGRKAVFTAIAGITETKEKDMEQIEKLTKQVADLTATVATFTTSDAKLKADNAELASKVAKFEADAKDKAEAEGKAAVAAKRAQITTILEDGVKSEGITPAMRDNFTKVLRLDDDTAVTALDLEQVKAMVPAGKKQFSREQGRQNGDGVGDLTVPEQVDAEVKAMLAKKEAGNYAEAQNILFTRNPKLARAYVDFNDKE